MLYNRVPAAAQLCANLQHHLVCFQQQLVQVQYVMSIAYQQQQLAVPSPQQFAQQQFRQQQLAQAQLTLEGNAAVSMILVSRVHAVS